MTGLPGQWQTDVVISESNAHRDVARIFEDLLGETRKGDMSVCVKGYVAELNCLYPTKYAKFGGSQSLSLVEVMFDNGSATRGDAVSRELRDERFAKYRDVSIWSAIRAWRYGSALMPFHGLNARCRRSRWPKPRRAVDAFIESYTPKYQGRLLR